MVGIGAIPAIVLGLLLPMCPESPRHLISHRKVDEAKVVLRRVFPNATPELVDGKVRAIQKSFEITTTILADKTLRWQFKQLVMVPANRRALITACMVMASKFPLHFSSNTFETDQLPQFHNSEVSTL